MYLSISNLLPSGICQRRRPAILKNLLASGQHKVENVKVEHLI